jgi:hypothetical protein
MVIIGATFGDQNKKLLVLGKTPTADSTIVRKHGHLPNFSCVTGIYRVRARKASRRWRATRHASAPKNLFFPALWRSYTSFHQRHDVPYMEHMNRPSGEGLA